MFDKLTGLLSSAWNRAKEELFGVDETYNVPPPGESAPPSDLPEEPRPPIPDYSRYPELEAPRSTQSTGYNDIHLCLDFGTSASAVGLVVGATQLYLAELEVAELPTGEYVSRKTIDSVFAIPRDIDHPDTPGVVLGRLARELTSDPDYRHFQSLKRRLSDTEERGDAYARLLTEDVAQAIQELLWLALYPKNSATLAYAKKTLATKPDYIEAMEEQLGFQSFTVEHLKQYGLQLHLAVPNAFGAHESRILQHGAQKAFDAVLDRLQREFGWEGRPRRPEPKLIREAESVVWWEVSNRNRVLRHTSSNAPRGFEGRWLVFDMGGGSTDAAIVYAKAEEGKRPSVQTIRHTGVALGGNDVDELLLASAAERGHANPNTHKLVDKLVGTRNRSSVLNMFAETKVAWSGRMASDAESDDEDASFSRWVQTVMEGPRQGKQERAEPLFFDLGVSQDIEPLNHADFAGRFAQFLRATVASVLDDLFDVHGNQVGDPQQVSRVILSGRGALIPGVKLAVTHYLRRHKLITSDTHVTFASPGADAWPDAMKLACVKGMRVATLVPNSGLRHFVSHEITVSEFQADTGITLWKQGTRLTPDAKATMILRRNADEEVVWRFFQHRFPRTMERYFSEPDRWGAYRQLASHPLSQSRAREAYLVAYDCKSWTIELWDITNQHKPFPVPIGGPAPELNADDNPVTGLPWGWRWPKEAQ